MQSTFELNFSWTFFIIFVFSLVSKVNQLEAKLAAANESQHNENQMLRRENSEILKQNSALQIDLNKSIDLMKTLQERNTLLEGKSESLSR